jgi:AcrR family transcriptional regulator
LTLLATSTFGKEELVRAYLEGRQASRRERIEKKLSACSTPRDKALAVFDALEDTISRPGFRGCAFVRASAETRSGTSPRSACQQSREYTRALFESLARGAGVHEPELIAQELVILFDGALISAQMDGNRSAARIARAIAEGLLDRAITHATH